MSEHAERRVGTIVAGKWRVDAVLGSGAMAAVFAVTHRNGAVAALKILHPSLCADPAVCERFLGEGYLTNRVKHRGIVRVLDDGMTDDGCVFLVMELLEGATLEDHRHDSGGRLDVVVALDIADQMMDALSAVHQAGIIHRDLKPQNVFLCDDGTVKILDFGVARILDQGTSSQLSLVGVVLGSPSFMAPEQALGQRDHVDHRTDIWSLGATLFTILTGQTVHLGPNVQAKLLAAGTMKARSIAPVRQDLPAPIATVIDKALRFSREDRWQSVDAFRQALLNARTDAGLPPVEMRPRAQSLVDIPPESLSPKKETLAMIARAAPVEGDWRDDHTQKMPGAPPPPRLSSPPLLAPPSPRRQPSDASSTHFESERGVSSVPAPKAEKRSFGVWLAVGALLLVVAGGAAFVVMSRASAHPNDTTPNVTPTQAPTEVSSTPVTAPTPTPSPTPTPTPSPPPTTDFELDEEDAGPPTPPKPAVTLRPQPRRVKVTPPPPPEAPREVPTVAPDPNDELAN